MNNHGPPAYFTHVANSATMSDDISIDPGLVGGIPAGSANKSDHLRRTISVINQ